MTISNTRPITPDLIASHGLKPDEYERILSLIGREPTFTELGIFSAMWNEHCSYKYSKKWLRTLPTKGPRVIQGPGENAGVVDIDDGDCVVFKMESHNHPSYIEPYQGAATGVGGIMRGLRTVPHLWKICEDMLEVCPNAILLQYVNPMAINTWAIAEKYPTIRQVGLCHSVQGTAYELSRDLDIPVSEIRYRAAGINHMAFFLKFEHKQSDGSYRDLYPDLVRGYREGRFPKPSHWNPRCPNEVRYEMLTRLGYFVTESSEHFAEYTPYFIKGGRPDLIEKFGIPLDEYPKRCVEQIERWKGQAAAFKEAETIEVAESHEYASSIMNSVWTGEPSVIYGNLRNNGCITSLPQNCAAEVPCLVDASGIQPTFIGDLPPQLTALIRTNINVQELTVQALMTENREHLYHAAMMDPHTAAELDLDQIWSLVDDLLTAHRDWIPEWARVSKKVQAA